MDTKEDVIAKLKASGLTGRGGAGFPTGAKWEMVAAQTAAKKFIICNSSEGEPGVFKDQWLWEHKAEEVVAGVCLALEVIDHSLAYLYLNHAYYAQFKDKLERICAGKPIVVFEKRWGYLGGEETAACEVIEGKRPVVRRKPPYPGQAGLWGFPTLINNVETFYHAAKVMAGEYRNTKFFCVSGDGVERTVKELPADATARQVLAECGGVPTFDFFAQVGGGATGEIWLPEELDRPIPGASSLVIYDRKRTDPYALMEKWLTFFQNENCDKCVPCREGVYRLNEMVKSRQLDRAYMEELFFVLENTSLCALGRSVATPLRSLINKVL